MSNVGPEGRSFLTIEVDDLQRLAHIAHSDREKFFSTFPVWAEHYRNRFICSALCQGAGLHYVSPESGIGINDFDVYNFYSRNPQKRWCDRRLMPYDFGSPKFGQSVDKSEFVGRRVDILGRSLQEPINCDPIDALQRYLSNGATESSRHLANKGIVLIEPATLLGTIIWPINI